MKKSKIEKTRASHGISIRWKLVVYLTVFVAIILLITWFFQVFLLDTFFRAIKRSEIEKSAQEITQMLGKSELEETAFRAAFQHSLDVVIYRLDETKAEQILSVTDGGMSLPNTISESGITKFYEKATQEGGFFISRIAFGGYEMEDTQFWDTVFFFKDTDHTHRIPLKNVRLIGTQIARGTDGAEYMIILTTALQPLDSTVRTLAMQYTWILAIVVLVTGIMVLFLYRKISKPIIEMNASAKRLAAGQYDANFSGKGYREARELADTLNYASHELSRADQLQKELIANISHDLRTPLTMIKGYGEVMRDVPGENTAENVQVIIDETTRLSELVNDLLDVSRIRSGTRTLEKTTFDLTEAVREVMGRYEAFTKHQGYEILFSAESAAMICADRSMMLQVLYNLINNAINYTGEDRRVLVKQTLVQERVRISVTDTGEGIDPEEMPLIWDRYYKVDKVHRRAMIGTGLGLSIVKEILELHGAAYGVDSTRGNGSTFWFELPTSTQET